MAVAVAETPVTGTLERVDSGGLLVPRRLPLRSNGTRLETLSVSSLALFWRCPHSRLAVHRRPPRGVAALRRSEKATSLDVAVSVENGCGERGEVGPLVESGAGRETVEAGIAAGEALVYNPGASWLREAVRRVSPAPRKPPPPAAVVQAESSSFGAVRLCFAGYCPSLAASRGGKVPSSVEDSTE